METIHDFKEYSFSTQLAICSFAIGTLLFSSFFILPGNDRIIALGLYFVVFAIAFNGLVLLNLIFQLLTIPFDRENIVIKILIILANIPIALIYFSIIIHQFNQNQL